MVLAVDVILMVVCAGLLALVVGLVHRIYHVHKGAGAAFSATVAPVISDAESMQISYADLVIGPLIAVGSSGKVYRGTFRGSPVAIKEVTVAGSAERVEQQLAPLIQTRHPSLSLCMGMARPKDKQKVYIVSEFMSRGSLHQLLHSTKMDITWQERMSIAASIVRAMLYLHTRQPPVLHRNLNSVNVLVNEEMVAKVADYGMSAISDRVREDVSVRPVWTSPEVLKSGKYSTKSDVYSFAMVLYELVTRSVPFAGRRDPTHVQTIRDITTGKRPPLPSGCPKELVNLLHRCWNNSPKARPSFADILPVIERLHDMRVDVRRLMTVHIDPDDEKSAGGRHDKHKKRNKSHKRAESSVPTEQWMIKFDEIKLGATLGVGSFGKVYEGTFRGKKVAVKMLHGGTVSEAQLEEFVNELNIMHTLRHPNTVLFMNACLEEPNMCIVMEHCARGSLFSILHDKSQHVDYSLIIKIAKEIAKGMNYLHLFTPPILHRDLKSLNILVDEDWNVKVGDFGMTEFKPDVDTNPNVVLGTPFWLAPEVMESQLFTEKADVYSYGMILWELFSRKSPFPDMNPHQAALAVLTDDARPTIPEYVPPRWRDLISECWARDASRRPSFKSVLKKLKVITNEGLPRLNLTTDNAHLYRKKHAVFAFRSKDQVTVFKSWGTGESKRGDWVIVGSGDDVYTCDAEIFEKTYEKVDGDEPNMYRKTGYTLAREMDKAFLIQTLEGTEHGAAGDFLAQNPVDGEQWPIDAETFKRTYERVPKSELKNLKPPTMSNASDRSSNAEIVSNDDLEYKYEEE
eukprot:TRINITY_DN1771_c0_g1_i1.p1 TRINITY_DN1771_c0_g1~~TRINITY_DN1771_c0_g1_i1.p1  ORF type:complete len:798 (+),score=383.68 TRINITY_DN1771_c0_g1_i1:124-2517(+)